MAASGATWQTRTARCRRALFLCLSFMSVRAAVRTPTARVILAQCPEIMYRWHRDYPLGMALSKVSGTRVLERLRDFTRDRGMPRHTLLSTEVKTVAEAPGGDG